MSAGYAATQAETVSDHVAWRRVMPLVTFPLIRTLHRVGPYCTVQRRLSTGAPRRSPRSGHLLARWYTEARPVTGTHVLVETQQSPPASALCRKAGLSSNRQPRSFSIPPARRQSLSRLGASLGMTPRRPDTVCRHSRGDRLAVEDPSRDGSATGQRVRYPVSSRRQLQPRRLSSR